MRKDQNIKVSWFFITLRLLAYRYQKHALKCQVAAEVRVVVFPVSLCLTKILSNRFRTKNRRSLVLDIPPEFCMSHAVQRVILALNLAWILR